LVRHILNAEVLSNLPPEIFWPSPRKRHVKGLSDLFPERVCFEGFWSEALSQDIKRLFMTDG
jgi:hypothetical protein